MMKAKLASFVVVFLIATTAVFAQNKTVKFNVYGNCGMCEKRIEKAASSVEGVTKAEWNLKNKMIEVQLDSTKSDVHKVHMAIAKVGHDTDMHKAKSEVYDKLPGCCKYDRPAAKKED